MKKILAILLACISVAAYAQETVRIDLGLNDTSTTISRHIYGQFAEHLGRSIYDGIYRHSNIRMDIVDALKKIKVPNLRPLPLIPPGEW